MTFDTEVAGETPNAHQQRLLRPYLALVPDMSEVQREHVLATLAGARAGVQAIQADTTLTPVRRDEGSAFVFSDLSRRISFAFTVKQLPRLSAVLTK